MKSRETATGALDQSGVRDRILETACALFYLHGVRAVGIDLVIAEAGVAKTSLYRHFKTKDDLVAAFLKQEDADFWATWDGVAEKHANDAVAELNAQLDWIGERVSRKNYRGCPQINTAAEFPEEGHPARMVAASHKRQLRNRLEGIAKRIGVKRPRGLAGQLALLINGAFVSSQILDPAEATPLLHQAAWALVKASRISKRGYPD